MRNQSWIVLIGVLAVGSVLSACSPATSCSPTSCPEGCCDASGICRTPTATNCGISGGTCNTCNTFQTCNAGVCMSPATGGGSAGGGTASSGGGSASTGGGTAANGGGTATNGGGTAANGGGTAANGGGSATAGGGTASTGGGTSATGGGVATYRYVSPSGNDSTGDGSQANPWKTLFKATSTVTTAGEVIKLAAGTYLETQLSSLAVGVSLEGAGVTTVIQSSVTDDWKAIVTLTSPEGTMGNQHISQLKLDGRNLASFWAIQVTGRSTVSIHDCAVVDFKDRGVIFDGRADNVPAAPVVFATGNEFFNNNVDNCAAYNTANGEYGRGALCLGGQDGMLIHDNHISQTSRPDRYNGWPIKYSLDGYNKRVKIYNNLLTKKPYAGTYGGDGDWDFAVEFWNSLGGNEMYGNTIQGAVDLAYNSRGTFAYDWYVHDNTFDQPALNSHFQSGIIFERGAEGSIVENNTFHNVSQGVSFNIEYFQGLPPLNTYTGVKIRRNLMTNIGRAGLDGNNGTGISFPADPMAQLAMSDISIDNNTIVAAAGSAPYEGIHIALGTTPATISNVNVRNNIIIGFVDRWFYGDFVGSSFTGLHLQNNLTFGNGNANAARFINGMPTATVISGNLTVDPQFVSASDFHLGNSSPAINAGIDVGLPFTGSAPDIGYAEH